MGDLLASAVRWAAADKAPFRVEGPGYLDCKLYSQNGKRILHLVNLNGSNQNLGYMEEILPVGAIDISIKLDGFIPGSSFLRVSDREIKPEIEDGWAKIRIDTLEMHELIVWE